MKILWVRIAQRQKCDAPSDTHTLIGVGPKCQPSRSTLSPTQFLDPSNMSRRSNRVKDAPPKLLEEPASDLEVSTDEDAGETVASATKPRGKKRKAAAEPDNGSISSTQQRKKVRGKRGILKDLVEMPMDVLFEVSSSSML